MPNDKAAPQGKNRLLWLLIALPYLLLAGGYVVYRVKVADIKAASIVIIDKNSMMLSHYDYEGRLVQKSGIACGRNPGNKKIIGDYKTPEGVFRVSRIEDAADWSHDFKGDTLGEIKGAYGPFFIRLDVPGQKGIGIHGTHDSASIGTRASEGCIRLDNREITRLASAVRPGTMVVILPGAEDIISDSKKRTDSIAKPAGTLKKSSDSSSIMGKDGDKTEVKKLQKSGAGNKMVVGGKSKGPKIREVMQVDKRGKASGKSPVKAANKQDGKPGVKKAPPLKKNR